MNALKKPAGVQLTREELHQLRWLLGGILTLVSVATVVYMEIEAWTLMTLTAIGVIGVVLWPSIPGRIPRWAHRLAFPLIVAILATDLWVSGELLPSLVRLDIVLLLYRGMTYRQKRDDLQVIVLGLFLVVVAGVLTVSLTFAVHLLAFTAVALALLLVITLAESSSTTPASSQSQGRTPEWARQVEWLRLLGKVRQVTDWRVVTMGSALFVGLVALSALLFVAIPRFQLENGLFLERFISKKSRTGFSESIKFGEVTDIQQDNSVALSVDVSDRNQIPVTPYWRMLVLDEYLAGTFRMSTALRDSAFHGEQSGRSVQGTRFGRAQEAAVWTFYLESGVSRYLPLLGPFQQLQFKERQSYRRGRTMPLVAMREEPVTMIAYRVMGMVTEPVLMDREFGAGFRAGGNSSNTSGMSMLKLQLSEDDLVNLARMRDEMGATELSSAAEFSKRATDWLRQRHGYSLQPKTPSGSGDPLVRWMNSREAGHCEFFAAALVVLARSAGVPARVIVGFRGGTWNGYSNNFTLRNSNAHAWCEVFDATTRSWLRVDPTPGITAGSAGERSSSTVVDWRNDRSWQARLESLRVFWYRRIVSFDQNSQRETLRAMKEVTENSSRRVRATLDHWVEKIRTWLQTPWSVRRLAGFVGLAAGLVVGGVAAFQLYRYLRLGSWRSHKKRSIDLVRVEAGRWLAKLTSARLATLDTPEKAEVIRQLQRIRFGQRDTWGDVPSVLRQARSVWRAAGKDRARIRG